MNTFDARAIYDRWASSYPPVAHNPLMVAEEQAVMRHLRGVPMSRALDAGAGTGRYAPILRASGAATVVSLDWSHEMLVRHQGAGWRVRGDARALPFAAAVFDVVNASLMAGDIEDLTSWLREIARVLSPGGRVIYSDFHPEWHVRGWRRTFQDETGTLAEVPCHPHSYDDHLSALSAAGFGPHRIDEVTVTPDRRVRDWWRSASAPPIAALLVVSATSAQGSPP